MDTKQNKNHSHNYYFICLNIDTILALPFILFLMSKHFIQHAWERDMIAHAVTLRLINLARTFAELKSYSISVNYVLQLQR